MSNRVGWREGKTKRTVVPYDFGAYAITREYEDVVHWHHMRFGRVRINLGMGQLEM